MSKKEGDVYIEPPEVNPGCRIGMRVESINYGSSLAQRPERRYIVFEQEDEYGWFEIMRMEADTWDAILPEARVQIMDRIRGLWG